MLDDWIKPLKLRMSIDEFHRLPRRAGCKFEYFNDHAWITPRLRRRHAVLELRPMRSVLPSDSRDIEFRLLDQLDWDRLALLFAGAFSDHPVLENLTDSSRREAAADCLNTTRSGGDGALVQEASFVATASDGKLIGAILVTRVERREIEHPMLLKGSAEEGVSVETVPHLTWVFVSPWQSRRGVATSLLAGTCHALLASNQTHLYSTFVEGNESSMLWHWRNGFDLLPSIESNFAKMRRTAETANHVEAS